MYCREKMDRASAKLSRARSALSLALKAGPEASKGELLDAITAALEHVVAADETLGEEEPRIEKPGHIAPAVGGQPRLVVCQAPPASSSLA